jgi:hypothetical protein
MSKDVYCYKPNGRLVEVPDCLKMNLNEWNGARLQDALAMDFDEGERSLPMAQAIETSLAILNDPAEMRRELLVYVGRFLAHCVCASERGASYVMVV